MTNSLLHPSIFLFVDVIREASLEIERRIKSILKIDEEALCKRLKTSKMSDASLRKEFGRTP
jgi:hypothetical protein